MCLTSAFLLHLQRAQCCIYSIRGMGVRTETVCMFKEALCRYLALTVCMSLSWVLKASQ